jgi:hypothetical protein
MKLLQNLNITGSMVVSGSTPNTIIGNTNFTGSAFVTGSLSVVNSNGNEFQVNTNGVNLGNALTDSHIISGSVRVNPNGLFISGSGFVGVGTGTTPSTFLHVSGSNTSNRGQLSIQSDAASAARATWYNNTTLQGEIGTQSTSFYASAVNDFEFSAGTNSVMRLQGNTRNGTLDLRGNLVSSFFGYGGDVSAGASWSMTINQILYEFGTSYMVDCVGFYAPGGVNIQAWATGIIHFASDGGMNRTNYANITSNGISISVSATNAGVYTVTFTNTAGSSQSNNNARIIKLNRMN